MKARTFNKTRWWPPELTQEIHPALLQLFLKAPSLRLDDLRQVIRETWNTHIINKDALRTYIDRCTGSYDRWTSNTILQRYRTRIGRETVPDNDPPAEGNIALIQIAN